MLVTKDVRIVYRDKRGRFSLGKFVDHDMFMVEIADDGVVTLTPMIAMPQKVSERIDEFLADPSKGVRVTRPGQRYEKIVDRG
jgi:hypothetical protein